MPLGAGSSGQLLVMFEEAWSATVPRSRSKSAARRATDTRERVAGLTRELAASREYLQSIIQDLEAANEELQSGNEEILSSNEELQSTNEELDTTKEELQSTHEERNTLNDELHARNEELSRVKSDLLNLIATVDITVLIIGEDLRIRRFTPAAERILNLIPGDVGRPVGRANQYQSRLGRYRGPDPRDDRHRHPPRAGGAGPAGAVVRPWHSSLQECRQPDRRGRADPHRHRRR